MLDNPFTYGNPISNPQRFIGRRREIEQAFSRLLNAEGESTSIVGKRRIGKTSLLPWERAGTQDGLGEQVLAIVEDEDGRVWSGAYNLRVSIYEDAAWRPLP